MPAVSKAASLPQPANPLRYSESNETKPFRTISSTFSLGLNPLLL